MRRVLAAAALLLLAIRAAAAQDAPVLAVVVAPAQAEAGFDAADLALIYERKRLYGPNGRRIEPVNLPLQHPLRRAFSLAVLKLEPAALDDYWNAQYFHGVRPPYVVASTAAMRRFVAQTPTAIGYLDACALDASVAVIGVIEQNRWRATREPPACTAPPPVP